MKKTLFKQNKSHFIHWFSTRCGLSGLIMVMVLIAAPAVADKPSKDELRLKTAYLINLARFVYWQPVAQGTPLQICIINGDSFSEMIAELKPTNIQQRSVTAQVLSAAMPIPETCNLVFIAAGHRQDWSQIMEKIKDRAVLTVGEEDDFIAHGGMIRFYYEKDRLRFAADPVHAKASGVQLSAKLLDLAKIETTSF